MQRRWRVYLRILLDITLPGPGSHILGMRPLGHNREPRFGLLGDGHGGEGQGLADLVGSAFNLEPVARGGTRQVVDVDVGAHPRRI